VQKIILFLFFPFSLVLPLFAEARDITAADIMDAVLSVTTEVVFSPNAGFSVYTLHSLHELLHTGNPGHTEASEKAVTYTIPAPSVGLDMHFIYKKTGLTLTASINAGFPITLYKTGGFGDSIRKIEGIIGDAQLMIGYTYEQNFPLSVRFGIGGGMAAGTLKLRSKGEAVFKDYAAAFFPAVFIDIHYAFTKHIGIHAGIRDMINFSGIADGAPSKQAARSPQTGSGFGNIFTLKIGASFRI